MKLSYCFLKTFNNYFNRKVRLLTDLEDYQTEAADYFIPLNSAGTETAIFDFNPNDNISTEAIVNNIPFEPDYLVTFDSNGDIVSRWFILEMLRTREGQWRYTLRRDVIAEKYANLRAAPVFVEKGYITDPENPLLLNHEDVTVNQIKSENEILLKDNTAVPWIVMYLAKGVLTDPNLPTVVLPGTNYDYSINTPIEQWEYWPYRDTPDQSASDFVTADSATYFFNYVLVDMPAWNHERSYSNSFDLTSPKSVGSTIGGPQIRIGAWNTFRPLEMKTYEEPIVKRTFDDMFYGARNSLKTQTIAKFGLLDLSRIIKFDNKTIKDSNNILYKLRVIKVGSDVDTRRVERNDGQLYFDLLAIWNGGTTQSVHNFVGSDAGITVPVSKYRISITEIDSGNVNLDLRNLGRDFVSDSPLFDVIALPYGNVQYTNPGQYLRGYMATAEGSMRIANEIATQLTSQRVLDIQLLPYCPVWIPKGAQGAYSDVGGYILSSSEDAGENTTIYVSSIPGLGMALEGAGGAMDIIYGVKNITRTFNIDISLTAGMFKNAVSAGTPSEIVKYVNDCTNLRLCSPNYAGLFDFNLAKNGMTIETFNVDMTLRPFNPFIHINPDFHKLYGSDTDDQRGLLCGGDFSLGILNDAWKQYELQNKNYQAIFDRQIQNLDVTQEIQRVQNAFRMIGGIGQGAIGGAFSGAVMGGHPIAGAAVGGAASLIGGIADMALLDKSQKEQKSFMKDNFRLQLGNVKALPTTITKTSALTANNKIFPFLEIYECTSEERDAYIKKLRWDGMTVGVVDALQNYESSDNSHFLKGKLIRLDTIAEDSHFLEAINEELMKGVYI